MAKVCSIFGILASLKVMASSESAEVAVGRSSSPRLMRHESFRQVDISHESFAQSRERTRHDGVAREGTKAALANAKKTFGHDAKSFVRLTKLLSANASKTRWILGGRGETCDTVCNTEGLKCDLETRNEVNTKEKVLEVAKTLKIGCTGFHDKKQFPEVPFHGGGQCFFSSSRTSLCNKTKMGHHQAMCFCRRSIQWSIVHATKGCENYFFKNKHLQIKSLSGLDLDECKKSCEGVKKCKTIDYFAGTMLCMLYDAACNTTQATSVHDQPSSWSVARS
eukprot:TRINITY_DN23119_c0_g1_i2.p1 TRINITY_DN23119_c0_g1~~TRINITY_DN23119_c0_g1_i2.p1  ORF type:complete len:279 (+),score=27.73 TRINITY_DN23119_c0_g1_i2:105-941(+)